MKKKSLFKLVGSVCMAMVLLATPLLGACGVPTAGSLNVGIMNFPRTKNPFVGLDADTISYTLIYEALLTHHGTTGEIMPLLAKSWDYDEEDVSYTFHLDPRAKFNDGTPVTATDVKYSWETAWTEAGKYHDVEGMVESIEVVDSRTVKFNLTEPAADFLEHMGYCFIVPEYIWSEIIVDGEEVAVMDWENPEPVGSGPYFWTEYVTDDHCTFEKNPNYWGGPLYVDVVRLIYYYEVETQLLGLRRGDIDTVNKLQMNSAVPTLTMDPNIEVYLTELNYSQQLLMNLRIEPFDVLEFRQAMNIVIDRNMMVNVVCEGYGIIPQQAPKVAPCLACANPAVKWPYELKTEAERVAMANALLDAIPDMSAIGGDGFREYKGQRVEFDLMVSTAPESVRCANVIAESCALVGIKINVQVQDFITAFGAVYRHQGKTPLGWDLFITGAPATPSFKAFHTGWVRPEPAPLGEGGYWQPRLEQSEAVGWTNETIQAKLVQQRQEMDPEKRLALQKEIQELWAADLPALTMYHKITPVPYRTDHLTGWIPDMYAVLYHKNVEGMWSPYHMLELRPVVE